MFGLGHLSGFFAGEALQKFDITLSTTGLVSYDTDANFPATKATGLITLGSYSGDVVHLDAEPAQLIINGVTYTYTSSGYGTYELDMGANVNASAWNTAAKLNASTDPAVNVATYTAYRNTISVKYDTAGTAGNSFTLGYYSPAGKIHISAPTLTGGAAQAVRYKGQYNNLNLATMLTSLGWLGIRPVLVNLTIDPNVYVGNLFGDSAFDTGVLPRSSRIYITNNGYIMGFGGDGGATKPQAAGSNGAAGGTALKIRSGYYVKVTNNGMIAGGGGGGGGGGSGMCGECYDDPGGGGGGGAGLPAGKGSGPAASYGKANSFYGRYGNMSVGGDGGVPVSNVSAEWNNACPGGDGGDLGVSGSDGSTAPMSNPTTPGAAGGIAGTGGVAGVAVDGFSNAVWDNLGTIIGQTP